MHRLRWAEHLLPRAVDHPSRAVKSDSGPPSSDAVIPHSSCRSFSGAAAAVNGYYIRSVVVSVDPTLSSYSTRVAVVYDVARAFVHGIPVGLFGLLCHVHLVVASATQALMVVNAKDPTVAQADPV